MKILHIIPNLSKGGAERLVTDIVRELKKREGLAVRLVLFRNEIEYDIEDIKDVVKVIPASVQLSLWKKNKLQVEQLQAFIDDFQPDIIHSHLFEAEIVSRSCYYPKAKWFSHFHDNMPQLSNFCFKNSFSKKTWLQFYEKQYLLGSYKKNRGNQFIAISKNAQNYAEKVLPKFSSVYYKKNAINYDQFFKEVQFSLTSNKIKLINVGSFQKKKNQQFILDIAFELKKAGYQVELTLLGDGSERKTLEQKTKKLKLENEVIFTGNVNKVSEYLAKADVYVHTATYEPFGLVLLEAMAAGLPVIALNGGGNADFMQNNENSFIYNEANVKQFATTIIELKNNSDLYERIAKAGQKTAKKYDIIEYAIQLTEIYKKTRL